MSELVFASVFIVSEQDQFHQKRVLASERDQFHQKSVLASKWDQFHQKREIFLHLIIIIQPVHYMPGILFNKRPVNK